MIKNQARDLAEMFIAGIKADTQSCKVASERKRLQASGIERSRKSAQEYTKAEHRPANVAFSLSHPWTWLSRSTSKPHALDDDETPLRGQRHRRRPREE